MTLEAARVRIRQAVEADRETLTDLIVRAFEDVTTNRLREQQLVLLAGARGTSGKPTSCARPTSAWS